MRSALLAFVLLLAPASALLAAEKSTTPVTGFFLTTRYPALTVRAGETATIDLSLRNLGLPPERAAVAVVETAPDWKATLLGGGQPVAAVMVTPNGEERLQLKLEPPTDIAPGSYEFAVEATVGGKTQRLPITVTIGEELPAKLQLSSALPALRGTPTSSFKYKVTINNDSGRDATINLAADAPPGFQVSFTEGYGTQQITSLPIEAGRSKDVDVSVTPPRETAAGEYPLKVSARTEAATAELPLTMTLVGQPRLTLTGEGGRLSDEAYAGKAKTVTLQVANSGTEVARNIKFSATAPQGWQTTFDPEEIAQLPAGGKQDVRLELTPSDRAIAGDYQMTLRASGDAGLSDSANFRITVLTSTLWGVAGIAIIAAALVVVSLAVFRFGRR